MSFWDVLVLDLDPQGNATTGLGLRNDDGSKTIYDVLNGNSSFEDSIQNTKIDNLKLVSSNVDLSGLEVETAHENRRAFLLKDKIESFLVSVQNPTHLVFPHVLHFCFVWKLKTSRLQKKQNFWPKFLASPPNPLSISSIQSIQGDIASALEIVSLVLASLDPTRLENNLPTSSLSRGIDQLWEIELAEYDFSKDSKINLPGYNPYLKVDQNQIEKSVDLINKAKKPIAGIFFEQSSSRFDTNYTVIFYILKRIDSDVK